ncbi:DUF4410 domain-containing protein [Novosphingobium lindaniclasticum]
MSDDTGTFHHGAMMSAPVVVEGAVNIIGFAGLAAGTAGRLEIDGDLIRFTGKTAYGVIPMDAVRGMSLEHSNKGLMRGVKGNVASMAPQAGQIYSMIRPGAETLTLFYVDERQGFHGAVLLLPKTSRQSVLQAFDQAGIQPASVMDDRLGDSLRPDGVRLAARGHRPREHSVRINLPGSNGKLPPAFVAATYEELVVQLRKSSMFETVWRQGDIRSDDDASMLDLDVTQYKKGNAGARGALPVVGMVAGKTLIRADLRFTDAQGTVVVQREVKGSVRMMGESIAASKSLAQRVSAALKKEAGHFEDAALGYDTSHASEIANQDR